MANNVTYSIIGFNRYSANGKEGCYLNLVEDYEAGNPDMVGSFFISMRAPYSEAKKLDGVAMSATAPATIEFVQTQRPFGQSMTNVCTEIIKVTPFKAGDSAKSKEQPKTV